MDDRGFDEIIEHFDISYISYLNFSGGSSSGRMWCGIFRQISYRACWRDDDMEDGALEQAVAALKSGRRRLSVSHAGLSATALQAERVNTDRLQRGQGILAPNQIMFISGESSFMLGASQLDRLVGQGHSTWPSAFCTNSIKDAHTFVICVCDTALCAV